MTAATARARCKGDFSFVMVVLLVSVDWKVCPFPMSGVSVGVERQEAVGNVYSGLQALPEVVA